MAKGTRQIVNTTVNKNTTENINKHDTNTQNTNTHFDVNKTTNTKINGYNVGGRSVEMQNSGNAGVQCFGLAVSDPNCKSMTLQNLHVPTQPIEHQIYNDALNKMSYLRQNDPNAYVQKLNLIQQLI